MRGAGLRLHGGVGEKRHLVVRLDTAHGARKAGGDIAVRAGDLALLGIESGRTKLRIAALDRPALPRSSQVTRSAFTAWLARHQESATTATASVRRTTRRTPRISLMGESSTDRSMPPNTGHCRMLA